MQFKEFVMQDEFIEYRRRELDAGVVFLKQIWTGESQYVRGALDMLSKIIRLPESFSDAPETKKYMEQLVSRDFAQFESKFLRNHLDI